MATPREALDAVGQLPDVEIDIAGAALHFARIDRPDADWAAAGRHLSVLAQEAVELARGMETDDLAARAGVLAGLIAGRHRYAGDTETYDDPVNANLLEVIRRRRGMPVALGVVWLHCTRALGWGAHGVNFPGHFLLALEAPSPRRKGGPARAVTGAQQIVLDVFAGGIPLDAKALRVLLRSVEGRDAELRPGLLAPMSARRVLLRLQENVRTRRLRHDDVQGALAATEDMLRISPDFAPLWREAAAMHQKLEQVAAALRCYAKALELAPDGDAAARTRAAMDDLRGRLN